MNRRNPALVIWLLLTLTSLGASEMTSRVLFDEGWVTAQNEDDTRRLLNAWTTSSEKGAVVRYKKLFKALPTAANRKIYIDFDGIDSEAKVYLNDKLVAQWGQGYRSFRVDATPHLSLGAVNTIELRLGGVTEPLEPDQAIGGHVWLIDAPLIHIAHWGTYVTTPEVTDEWAVVEVETTVDNNSGKNTELVVRSEILSDSEVVATLDTPMWAKRKGLSKAQLTVVKPKRWDEQNQHLYTLRTSLVIDEEVVDQKDTRFGIRRTEWEAYHREAPLSGTMQMAGSSGRRW